MIAFTKYRNGFRIFFFSLLVAACPIIGISGFDCSAQVPVIKNIRIVPSEKTAISNKDMQTICTAAISTLFNQPTTSISAESIEKGMMHLSMLPIDGASRQFICKIEGKKILLAAKDDSRQAGDSREQVTFQLLGDEILITVSFPDGSEKQNRFPRQ